MKHNHLDTLALELSSYCNMSCLYCDNRFRNKYGTIRSNDFMPLEMIDYIIAETDKLKVKPQITLSYEGESTLHPDFEMILNKFHTKKFNTWLSTNAINMDLSLLELISAKCSNTCISIHNEETFIRMTELLQKKKFKNICFSWVIDSFKIPSVDRWKNKYKGVLSLGIPVYFWLKTKYSARKIEIHDKKPVELHLKRRKPCQMPFKYIAVLSDGMISPCCITSRFVLDKINIYDGIDKILSSNEYLYFLNRHYEIKLEEYEVCLDCEYWLEGWLGDIKVNMLGKQGIMQGFSIFIENENQH